MDLNLNGKISGSKRKRSENDENIVKGIHKKKFFEIRNDSDIKENSNHELKKTSQASNLKKKLKFLCSKENSLIKNNPLKRKYTKVNFL